MSTELRFFLIIGVVLFLMIIISMLKRKKLNLKYTLVWLFAAIFMLLAAIMPDQVGNLAHFIGIETPSNFVFVLEGMFVLVILLSITAIVSHLNLKIYKLVQMQAILEKRVRELEQLEERQSEATNNSWKEVAAAQEV